MNDSRRKYRLGWILSGLFLLAVVMGAGPGIFLVNPDPDAASPRLVIGVPVVYAWAVSWFGVQAAVVLVAYFTLWKDPKR